MRLSLPPLTKGRLSALLAESDGEMAEALGLRRAVFRARRGLDPGAEGDRFDALSQHLLVRDGASVLATCRLRLLDAQTLPDSYSAQFFDLRGLTDLPVVELGRLCLAPEAQGLPDVLRLVFAALTRAVDGAGARALVGCSSFQGTNLAPYAAALAPHAARLTRAFPPRAAESLSLAALQPGGAAPLPLPPLLRHYLALGGRLSESAVVDRDLGTCLVFTHLPLADLPPAHAAALRALAAED